MTLYHERATFRHATIYRCTQGITRSLPGPVSVVTNSSFSVEKMLRDLVKAFDSCTE